VSVADATYRELIDAAFSAAGRASFALMRHRFVDGQQAREAVAAYRDLLDAVRVHAHYLNPLVRREGPASDTSASDPVASSDTPLFARSIAMLAERGRRSFPAMNRESLPEVALLWRRAATSLRASQDLLDTHRSPDFGWRSPDAWLVDHAKPQAAATESLAGFLRAIAGSGQALALRAREVDRTIDCTDILDSAALRLAAASLTHYAHKTAGVPALDELRAIREAQSLRIDGQPLSSAVNAMNELRQQAWEHARSGHVSIRTIGVYAALATSVYQHAAVIAVAGAARAAQLHLGTDPAATSAQLQRSSQQSIAAAHSWGQVRRMCARLKTTAVPHPEIYELLLAVRADLATVTRDRSDWRQASLMLPDADVAHRVFTAVHELVASLEEISAWHQNAVARLAEAGQLYIAASDVDREQISDDHTLAAALLTRKPIPLPQRQTAELLEAFAHADGASWSAARTETRSDSVSRLRRPAFSRMREMYREAGRPNVGL
jgi:hypothetical protein